MRKYFILIGLVIFLYGICLCIFSNLNLGVVLVPFVGLISVATGVFYPQLSRTRAFNIFKKAFCVLLCLEALLICFIMVFGCNDSVSYNEDAVIVLGAGIRGYEVSRPLEMRLDAAIEYYQQNPDALIVVSGGMGFQELISEAEAMKKYLVDNGVSGDRIIKEDAATSTKENMLFSKKLLDSRLEEGYKVAIITNDFHIYRSSAVAKRVGFENVYHKHAPMPFYDYLPSLVRESLAVIKLWLVD